MDQKHYKHELDRFVHHELERNDHQAVAEHLLVCGDCRAEHDLIRSGALLALQMQRCDAPPELWKRIDNALDQERSLELTLASKQPYLRFQTQTGVAVGVLLAAGIATAIYFSLLDQVAEPVRTSVETEQSIAQTAPLPNLADLPENANINPANLETALQPAVQSPDSASSLPFWNVETIAGDPNISGSSASDRLAVGDYLETDNQSKAQISVANIGNVVVEPNSRVKLVGTAATEHRLSLERGALVAQIAAPPRLFIVDTPSAVAVDLGCAYRLEVDKDGDTRLHVTAGFVALERGGRESIVPAGAVCITRRSSGLGTPFALDASDAFQAALQKFDFENGGSRSVTEMLASRGFYDMVTLWHLLSRVQKGDREKVFDACRSRRSPGKPRPRVSAC
jgi:hypothetical protein